MSIDTIISLSDKKTELLKELRESMKYESCLYDVRKVGSRFIIFEISSKQEMLYGTAPDCLRWIERRKIPHEKVYNIEFITPLIPNHHATN